MVRLPSDHDAVSTYRARVARLGGTRRRCIRLPGAVPVVSGDYLRLVVDGDDRHTRVHTDDDGRLLRGAYANRRLARTDDSDATNHLDVWLTGFEVGSSVDLDEVVPGVQYGVREPGDRVVYGARSAGDACLDAIAETTEYGTE